MRQQRRIWWAGIGLMIVVVGATLLWPAPAMAGCDLRDVSCHGHNLTYNAQKAFATALWIAIRGLLMMARIVEGFRVWLIDQVLREVLAKVLKGLEGVFVISIVIAVMLLWFSFFVQSLVSLNWVDARRALRNGFFAIMIFLYGGQLAAGFEQARVVGGGFMGDLARGAVTTVGAGGVSTYSGPATPTEVVALPGTIYSTDICETGTARATPVIMLNDLAANYVFATEKDIHCPNDAEGRPAMPIAFWDAQTYTAKLPDGSDVTTNTPGYFAVEDIGRIEDENERQRIINRAGAGLTRMSFAIPMAIMAVLEQLAQLLYALCLMAIWFGLSISLVLSLYLPTEEIFTRLITDGLNVFKGSLLSSLYIAIGASVLQVIIASSNSNGLIVGLIGILNLVLLSWIIKQAGALFLSTIASVGSSTAGGFGRAVVGAAVGAAAAGGVLTAQAQRQRSAYKDAYDEYAEEYGADTKQQREAAGAYAKRKASDATRGTLTQDLMRVMRAGTDIATATRDPLGTLARIGDRAAVERQHEGLRDELRGLRQDMAGDPAGAEAAERGEDGLPLTSAQAGAAMAAGQAPQGVQDGRRKLRDLVATARRDGRLGTTSSLREVDEEIERLTALARASELQLDQQGGLMDDGDRKGLKERIKQLESAIHERRELRDEIGKVMMRSERASRGDLSHQSRVGSMTPSEASEVMRRRRRGEATAEQASDAAVILGEASRKRAPAEDWRDQEGDPTSETGSRQMVGRAVGGLQREMRGYQVDADRARRVGDLDALQRAEQGEMQTRSLQDRYLGIGNAVRVLDRPGSTEQARASAVEQLEAAAKTASDDYDSAAERGSDREMREAEQRGKIARQALARAADRPSASASDPAVRPQATQGYPPQVERAETPESGASPRQAILGDGTTRPSPSHVSPAHSAATTQSAGASTSQADRVDSQQGTASATAVRQGDTASVTQQPMPKTTVPLTSSVAASAVAPVVADAQAVSSASVTEAARATAHAQAAPTAPTAASAAPATQGAPAAASAAPAAQAGPSVQVAPVAPAAQATPVAAPSVQAAPAVPVAVPGVQVAPPSAPVAQATPVAGPGVQVAPAAPAAQATPVAALSVQVAPPSAPVAQATPVAAPSVQVAPVAPSVQVAPPSAPVAQATPVAALSVQVAPPSAPVAQATPVAAPSVQVAPAAPAAQVTPVAAPSVQVTPPRAPAAQRTPVDGPTHNAPSQPPAPMASSVDSGRKVRRRVASIERGRR